MTRKLNYKYGEIELGEKSIRIEDEKFRNSQKISGWFVPLVSAPSLLYFLNNGFTGVAFDYMHTLLIVMSISILIWKRNFVWDERVEIAEVRTILLRKRWFTTLLDIELTNGKTRRVGGVAEIASGIQKYLKENGFHE